MPALGDHLPVEIGVKAVDHDTVQTGEAIHLPGHGLAEVPHTGRGLQTAYRRLHQREEVGVAGLTGAARRLQFQHRHACADVHADIQGAGARPRGQGECIGRAWQWWFALQHLVQLRLASRPYDPAYRMSEQLRRRFAEMQIAVLAGLQNAQVAKTQHEQCAVRLDAAGRVHRFAVAGRQRGAMAQGAVGAGSPGRGRFGGARWVHGVQPLRVRPGRAGGHDRATR